SGPRGESRPGMPRRPDGAPRLEGYARVVVGARDVYGPEEVRDSPGKVGKEPETIAAENAFLDFGRESEGPELVEILPQVFHPRTGPVGTPDRLVGDLLESGKIVEQPSRRDA